MPFGAAGRISSEQCPSCNGGLILILKAERSRDLAAEFVSLTQQRGHDRASHSRFTLRRHLRAGCCERILHGLCEDDGGDRYLA